MKIAVYVFFLIFYLTTLCFAENIILVWDPNTETDLAGYKIYYKQDLSGIPYNGVDIDQGSSPIVITILDENDPNYMDPNDPEFLLTGLDCDNHDYYLVVTAFDDEEPFNESGYSNEVNTIDDPVNPPDGGGSNNGGGCFISICDSVD